MKLKFLYLAQNSIESNIIKDILSERNIESTIYGNNLQSILGGIAIDATFCKIYVSEDNYSKAKMIIEKYKENLNIDEIKLWVCDNCNEKCPISIHTCWNCNEVGKFKENGES